MAEVIPHQKATAPAGRKKDYLSAVTSLDYGDGSAPVTVRLECGTTGLGTCLGCFDSPCMRLPPSAFTLHDALASFPGDPSTHVCPTEAISWNEEHDFIDIDRDLCIGCGACIALCPFGALSANEFGLASIETSDPSGISIGRQTTSPHPDPVRTGRIASPNAESLRSLPAAIGKLNDRTKSLLVRSLFIACGVPCRIRRAGDTNIRMDGVIGISTEVSGVLEIELKAATSLESPRALLEDVAVLHNRFDIPAPGILPISCVLSLPNERSEYYSVVDDIEQVLGLRCRTVSLGALAVLAMHFVRITEFGDELFSTSQAASDLSASMKHLVPSLDPIAEPYPGAYSPLK